MSKRKIKIISVIVTFLLLLESFGRQNYIYATGNDNSVTSISSVEQFESTLRAKSKTKSTGLIPYQVKITKNQTTAKSYLQSTTIPSNYDLRQHGWVTNIKNQGQMGSCWTFAANASIESNLLRTTGKTYDLSEINMATHNGIDNNPDGGGNNEMAAAYLADWQGTVNETDDPYPNAPYASNVVVKSGAKIRKHVQDVIYIPNRLNSTDNNEIKSAVMNYGVVSTSIYMDEDAYYNETSSAYYGDNSSQTNNHQIDIIGWDDNYDKSNFKTAPAGNGAFLCRNSWGESFGNKGYFYVSYYDVSIGKDNAVFDGIEGSNNYSRNYQYDKMFDVTSYYDGGNNWYSNVFTANSDTTNKENLSAVSFYTDKENTSYEVYVESNYDTNGFTKISSNKLASGSISMPGYHTIKLSGPVGLTAGKHFAVAVKVVGSDIPKSGIEPSSGNSFTSGDGVNWNSSVHNVCLKAFTNIKYQTSVTGVSLNHTALTLSTNSTSSLVATVAPSTATDKNIIWESSDDSVATVDDSGKVKAISGGTAVITATSEDGSYKATCTVTVPLTKVKFNDVNLENGVRTALGKSTGDVTDADMMKLTTLILESKGIRNLTGLEYAQNLTTLDLSYNKIKDISPIKGLVNMKNLLLDSNKITDITALKGMTNLQVIDFKENYIRDISAVSNLKALMEVRFDSNNISDVSALQSQPYLEYLYINGNELTDIQPIVANMNQSKLPDITWADVRVNDNYLDLNSGTSAYNEIQTLHSKGVVLEDYDQLSGEIVDYAYESKPQVYGTLTIGFNNNIVKGTAFNNITLKDGNNNAISFSASISGNKLIIKPSKILSSSTDYYVNLPQNSILGTDNKTVNNKTITFITTASNGDVNGDSTVDIKDVASAAKNYNINWNNVSSYNANFDLNDDGITDIYDITGISKCMK